MNIRTKVMGMAEAIKKNLQTIALVISIVMGSTSLGFFVWKGGALVREFELFKEANRRELASMELRISKIEQQGSHQVGEHVKLDDQRETNNRERFARLEAIVEMVPNLATKLAVIDVKLDDLKASLDKHERNTSK